MSRSLLVIEVSPTRLEAAVTRAGRIVRSAAVRHHIADWEQLWPGCLDTLRAPLQELVQNLEARSMPAIVLASSPGSAVTLHSCAASAGSAAAHSSAMLALGNLHSSPLHESASFTLPVFTDRSIKGATDRPMRHVLAAAESDESCAAVARWIESAGLRFEGLLPTQAIGAFAAARAVLDPRDQETRAVVWMNEHHSFLAVGSSERLRFVRPVAIGTESLVDALTRPILRKAPDAEPVTLSRDEARGILDQFGIPEPSHTVDASRALDGAALLPVLQPALQRLGIEVKQSLRFGLSESERNDARLLVMGQGCHIRHLENVLRRHVTNPDAPNAAGVAHAAERASADDPARAISTFLNRRGFLPPMFPRALANTISLRRTRGALRAGIAAALAIVAIQGISTVLERRSMGSGAAQADSGESNAAAATTASAREAERALSSAVKERLGGDLALGPLLSTFASASQGRVQLQSIETSRTESGRIATLRGVTSRHAVSVDPLREFIAHLEQCPLVKEADLKHAQRSQGADESVQAFEVELRFIDMPPLVLQAAAAKPDQEEAQ